MFSLRFHQFLFKYLMVIVLLECMSQVLAVERWVDEDHFKSGRVLLGAEADTEIMDMIIFFVVLVVGLAIAIPLIRSICRNDDGRVSRIRDISATVHPPPRGLVQQQQYNVSFTNTSPAHSQVNLIPVATAPSSQDFAVNDDKPPDYSAVVIGDLSHTTHQTPYPVVSKNDETRPPSY